MRFFLKERSASLWLMAMSISIALVCISFEKSHAQSNRRLCGYTSSTSYFTPEGRKMEYHIAFVGEVDIAHKDSKIKKACEDLISKAKKRMPNEIKISFPGSDKAVFIYPNWHKHTLDYGRESAFTLTLREGLKCEKLGKKYKGQGIPKDICKKMDTGPLYKLVKENSEKKATITFEACLPTKKKSCEKKHLS